jgi:fructose-specific phosphotransferase system component IIB
MPQTQGAQAVSAPDTTHLRLVELTERRGQKITARDIATARMAIAAIDHLRELSEHYKQAYVYEISTSVDRGIQLDTVREMLGQIREILE